MAAALQREQSAQQRAEAARWAAQPEGSEAEPPVWARVESERRPLAERPIEQGCSQAEVAAARREREEEAAAEAVRYEVEAQPLEVSRQPSSLHRRSQEVLRRPFSLRHRPQEALPPPSSLPHRSEAFSLRQSSCSARESDRTSLVDRLRFSARPAVEARQSAEARQEACCRIADKKTSRPRLTYCIVDRRFLLAALVLYPPLDKFDWD